MHISSSKEFTIIESGSKNENISGPFNPLALNLSKIPKPRVDSSGGREKKTLNDKNEAIVPKIGFGQQFEKDLTVTLAPKENNNEFLAVKYEQQTIISLNDAYKQARNKRGIYMDDELHWLMIFLIFSLILTPERGTLDDLYCTRKPLEDDKPHVLHYLHYHLNHYANQTLIPKLLRKVSFWFWY